MCGKEWCTLKERKHRMLPKWHEIDSFRSELKPSKQPTWIPFYSRCLPNSMPRKQEISANDQKAKDQNGQNQWDSPPTATRSWHISPATPGQNMRHQMQVHQTFSPVQTQISPTKNSKKSENIEPPHLYSILSLDLPFQPYKCRKWEAQQGSTLPTLS